MPEILKTDAFEAWFGSLKDRRAKGRILMRLRRMELGNPGVVAPVGTGVSEMKIDYGPGYRIYFKQVGVEAFLILWGGDKSSQMRDVRYAKRLADAEE